MFAAFDQLFTVLPCTTLELLIKVLLHKVCSVFFFGMSIFALITKIPDLESTTELQKGSKALSLQHLWFPSLAKGAKSYIYSTYTV
jgi:hypothetical protein